MSREHARPVALVLAAALLAGLVLTLLGRQQWKKRRARRLEKKNELRKKEGPDT